MERPLTDEDRRGNYIGDGAYVRWDGYQLWVFTTDGDTVQNEVALERETAEALVREPKSCGLVKETK